MRNPVVRNAARVNLSPMPPTHEVDTLTMPVTRAIDFAADGKVAGGDAALVWDLHQAEEMMEEGEGWGAELRDRWRLAVVDAVDKEVRCMADQEDVRRIALALPDTSEGEDHFAFAVRNKGKQKGFVWAWNERIVPKKPRVPRADVVAIRVAGQLDKEALLALDAEKFFTEPHYHGFPAILVRLPLIDLDELEELLVDAWRCQAPRALVEAWEKGEA
jgi:hypothetical protein